MPYLSNNTELKIKKNEDSLKKLIIEIELLQKETEQLFTDLNICPLQLESHLENQANFTKEDWEALQDHKLKLDQKFETVNSQVVDPLKAIKTRNDMRASQNWLYVR